MHEVEVLRLPLVFGRAHADLTLSEGGAMATKTGAGFRVAAGKVAMRSGRHFSQFIVVKGYNMLFGVIRPDWEGGYNFDGNPVDASAVDGHCFYNALNGRCSPGYIEFD